MLTAVPTLSPVSIQTLTPPFRREEIASPTPSCSLSSIAVAPTSTRSFSIPAMACSRACCRFSRTMSAACMPSAHARYLASGSTACATKSVRRPSFTYSSRWALVASSIAGSFTAGSLSSRSRITLSAPLVKSMSDPSAIRTMTEDRLRSEENSRLCRMVNATSSPSMFSVTSSCLARTRLKKARPQCLAAYTRAASSGLEAERMTWPSGPSSGITSWFRARERKNSCVRWARGWLLSAKMADISGSTKFTLGVLGSSGLRTGSAGMGRLLRNRKARPISVVPWP
mmetsp:Transcript_8108/g.18488  ORF Transcript_8108/g.18488 Transcript_8108/m.18488 type:complete len:285 (-) Transcript_8108:908-1762(-)